ncbi:MAG: tRNA lysidine(34) synthetase TilS [Patescibacteria group bacterium]|nr:tRNA lysidine(34) synthetase TilS [Patescibacteria group bacterium]
MQITLPPGTYVAAISGGVDSMVLLHLLSKCQDVTIVVAHFDHGMRPDSDKDRDLVHKTATALGLPFVSEAGNLNSLSSEATARTARYAFLRQVQKQYQAEAIITAHHEDDVIETAIINLARGTGRRGLSSLASTRQLLRPLLDTPKSEIIAYANQHQLSWREDSSNADQKYLRNYIRHSVLPLFSAAQRQQFVSYITSLRSLNQQLDSALAAAVEGIQTDSQLNRSALTAASPSIIKEILAAWWRANGFTGYETKTLQRALHDVRYGQTGATIPLKGNYYMTLGRQQLALHNRER